MNIISNTMNYVLQSLFNLTGDWGITIILLTIGVRLIMLPLSIKQKKSMEEQKVFAEGIQEIQEKYKNDKEKLDLELQKAYTQSAKSMLGCFTSLMQLPVMFALYRVIINMPMEVGTIIVPWISSMKLPDRYFIIPVVSILTQMLPNLLSTIGVIKSSYIPKITKSSAVMIIAMNLLFLAKAPITIGVYWIATNFFSIIEQFVYILMIRNKALKQGI